MIDSAGFITCTYVAKCVMQYQSESVTMIEKIPLISRSTRGFSFIRAHANEIRFLKKPPSRFGRVQ